MSALSVSIISTLATLAVSIISLVVSLLVTHRSNRRNQVHKDELERVNLQLRNVYGPLYSSVHAGDQAWEHFCIDAAQIRGSDFLTDGKMTDEEVLNFKTWVEAVFMPINLRLEKIIYENGDLIEGSLDPCLMQACTHINAYKAIVARWREPNYKGRLKPSVDYPTEDLLKHLKTHMDALQGRQQRLIRQLDDGRTSRSRQRLTGTGNR